MVIFTEGVGRGTAALVGVDLATRERAWEVPRGDVARGSPTVEGDGALVGTRDGFVYAVDGATGDQLWKVKTTASVDTTPAVALSRVYVVSENESTGDVRLAALDVATGRSR